MLTLTKGAGTGGEIKQAPEDFLVKEITKWGVVLQPDTLYDVKTLGAEEVPSGKHISFVLQKRDWNTVDALLAIARKLGHGRKSIAYAGSKDKKAISVQLASIYHEPDFDLGSVRISGIGINGFWRSNGVGLGDELGNAFEVKVRNPGRSERLDKIVEELGGRMPNYFGAQRFGERANNAKIGVAILKGDFEGAAIEYLTGSQNERNEEVRLAREELRENLDFRHALERFPRYLRGERTVLDYLTRYPGNYANALKLLPRGIALMFVHAVQAQIFNEELEQRAKNENFKVMGYAGRDFYGFPDIENRVDGSDFPLAVLVGYETPEEQISDYARDAMRKLQLSREDFRSKGMPELAMKGDYRTLLAPVKDLSYRIESDGYRIAFSLPRGSYATVLIDEVVGSASRT